MSDSRKDSPVNVVIGAFGQDGVLLCRELEANGARAVKVARGDYDLLSPESVASLFTANERHDVFFLAAHHRSSTQVTTLTPPEDLRLSLAIHVSAPATILEVMRQRACGDRFFYASSSRVFGQPGDAPQTEATPRSPTCVYGITKAAGMDVCAYYRSEHGIFASSGILYNHESSLRPADFVSRRIVLAAVDRYRTRAGRVRLANPGAEVDWSWAPDIVRAMLSAIRNGEPQDYVMASGKAHSVADFARFAFDEIGEDWKNCVEACSTPSASISVPKVGNPAKLIRETGWQPKLDFEDMVRLLVREELVRQQC